MAGVQADAEALLAAGGLEQRRQLLEGAPERAARAGRVLEQQRARLGLRQRLLDDLPGALDRLVRRPPFFNAEPGCRTTPTAFSWAPALSATVSAASDLSRISGSSDAQLSR